jgi:hypothetical protein
MIDNDTVYDERSNEDAFYDRYGAKPSFMMVKEVFKPKSPEDLSDVFELEDEEESY